MTSVDTMKAKTKKPKPRGELVMAVTVIVVFAVTWITGRAYISIMGWSEIGLLTEPWFEKRLTLFGGALAALFMLARSQNALQSGFHRRNFSPVAVCLLSTSVLALIVAGFSYMEVFWYQSPFSIQAICRREAFRMICIPALLGALGLYWPSLALSGILVLRSDEQTSET